jgi:hypothetical protein
MTSDVSEKLCGKPFGLSGLATVQQELLRKPAPNRAELARRMCAPLDWHDPKGRPQLMSARVALLRLHRAGHICLPPPTKTNGNCRRTPVLHDGGPAGPPVTAPARELSPLRFENVQGRTRRSREWNALIQRHHYLGYAPIPGAQVRYFVQAADGQDVALISFGASAWNVAARDHFIGWNEEQRRSGLARILNNARFLILPWVHSPNLASMILGACARRIPKEFEREHGVEVLLLESFVQCDLFAGTCYRAAGWQRVGTTCGRGRNDRLSLRSLPPKDVWLRPLRRDWRSRLQHPCPQSPR